MPSGGARVRSGPPPDPNALRRERDGNQWVTLPRSREGDPPDWPLTAANERECELWNELWHRPQAWMWEQLGQEFEVALYVRRLGEAEEPGATAALTTLVRQMADALGLTIPGLRTNRWRLPVDEVAQRRVEKPAKRTSSRNRLKVVPRGDGA